MLPMYPMGRGRRFAAFSFAHLWLAAPAALMLTAGCGGDGSEGSSTGGGAGESTGGVLGSGGVGLAGGMGPRGGEIAAGGRELVGGGAGSPALTGGGAGRPALTGGGAGTPALTGGEGGGGGAAGEPTTVTGGQETGGQETGGSETTGGEGGTRGGTSGTSGSSQGGAAGGPVDACQAIPLTCGSRLVAGSTSGTDAIDGYECGGEPLVLGKPERLYRFDAVANERVVVTVSNASGTARILVLEGGCAASDCVTQNFHSRAFEALPGETYYFAVEPFGNDEIDFDISVICDAPAEESGLCDDSIDNDGDFLRDCVDDDCRDEPSCGFGTCTAVTDIDCSTRALAGTTDPAVDPDATDVVDSVGCAALPVLAGNERVYRFQLPDGPASARPVLFTLSPPGSGFAGTTGVAVLEDTGNGCDPFDCVSFQWYGSRATVETGKTYYVVVDRMTSGSVDYYLSAICDPPEAETPALDCGDGIDNDGDGQIDCADPDCNC